jgi:hypothetical protein
MLNQFTEKNLRRPRIGIQTKWQPLWRAKAAFRRQDLVHMRAGQ